MNIDLRRQTRTLVYSACFVLLAALLGCSTDGGDSGSSGPTYRGSETTMPLVRGGSDQFLLPVEIGNQTFRLLVDTGSNALLVFGDLIARDNSAIEITDTAVSKAYSSTIRSGRLATAPVRIGGYTAEAMRLLVIDAPNSKHDPSLTAKKADGVIGLRRTDGLNQSLDDVLLDVPLTALKPAVNSFELDLPPAGDGSLSLGRMPTLETVDPAYLFHAKTLSLLDPVDKVTRSYSDLQVPFRVKSSAGEADDEDLDILLDTGAVSKLVLDTAVAQTLGYDPATKSWSIPDDEEIELNLIGPNATLGLRPKFRVSEIKVAPYSTLGVEFEAVLGISRWQEYVVGFSFVDYQGGGPDGTVVILPREELDYGIQLRGPASSDRRIVQLPELNSLGDDRFPDADASGNTVVFQSNRPEGLGSWDVYVYRAGEGILTLPGLNSSAEDADPSVSGDGRFVAFHSNRAGGHGSFDIYLYDTETSTFVPIPGLNSEALERNPSLSDDGRYLAFRSERAGGAGGSDLYLYDRQSEQLVDLPGLNSSAGEYDPSLSGDGRYLSFHFHAGARLAVVERDIGLYDVQEQRWCDLPEGTNSVSNDMASAISPDGNRLLFTSTRNTVEMGLYDRDLIVVDRKAGVETHLLGLNSQRDENGVTFSGNGTLLFFHSDRPGGQGGSDIYGYRLDGVDDGSSAEGDVPAGDLPLTRTTAGAFTVPVSVGGTTLQLLVDTTVSELVLFEQALPTGSYDDSASHAVTLNLADGTLSGRTAAVDLTLGAYAATDLSAVIAAREDVATLSNLPLVGVDGVIGFRFKRAGNEVVTEDPAGVDIPLAALSPTPHSVEFNLAPSGAAGISLGTAPITGEVQSDLLFSIPVQGIVDAIDPVHLSFTDLEVPFGASTDAAATDDAGTLLLSTRHHGQLVLDANLATSLGYDAAQQNWGDTETVNLYLAGVYAMLPLEALPVDRIEVRDLSRHDYTAVLGLDQWQQFVVFFDYLDYQGGGPRGVVSLLDRLDYRTTTDADGDSADHFVALPGLNSIADDTYGDISADGQTIVFQSDRTGGAGGMDVYVYRIGDGLLDLPNLNSAASDADPSVNQDGTLVAFHSDRGGDFDIYLYDIEAQTFVPLTGVNSEFLERSADLSPDGRYLAFRSERPHGPYDRTNSDLYVCDLTTGEPVPLGWLNTRGREYDPSLSRDGLLMSYHAVERDDAQGGRDVYLHDVSADWAWDLPLRANSAFTDAASSLAPGGDFMAFHSERDAPEFANTGRDIFLFEVAAGEFISLPGINSRFEDSAPCISEQAEYILFHSKRPTSLGGYDLYLYQTQ